MKWVADKTGRFPERPHYEREELELECEELTHSILRARHDGRLEFPVSTDDLMVMIEQAGADLDLYADLSGYGSEVEALSEFAYGRKPFVKVSRHLTDDESMQNRLRTTLTHECGHVKFHRFLWDMKGANHSLFPEVQAGSQVCKREKILTPGTYDWMEWQAGYCCGALLMPLSDLRGTCHEFLLRQGTGPLPIRETTAEGQCLIGHVAATYMVSRQAAQVRLLQIGVLSTESGVHAPLWG